MKTIISRADREVFFARLDALLDTNGMSRYADAKAKERLFELAVLLTEYNAHTNLTAITDIDGVIVKHFIDSMTLIPQLDDFAGDRQLTLADIGCGAGFPSLPIAILRPQFSVTCVDSTAKKLEFIRLTAKALALDNVTVLCARAEELAHTEKRETFDVVTARGVARLNILSELCLPLVRIGGAFIPMKASMADEELNEAHKAISLLGGEVCSRHEVTLSGLVEPEVRTSFVIKKAAPSQKLYPRLFGAIKKKPLGL